MNTVFLFALLACAVSAAVPSSEKFGSCVNLPRDTYPLSCVGESAGVAEVIGVVRNVCPDLTGQCLSGDEYSYQVEIEIVWNGITNETCNVTIPWNVVPFGSNDVLCGTTTRCVSTDCATIQSTPVVFSIEPPVFVRELTPVYRFPYEYIAQGRRKSGVSQNINDDDTDDSSANGCLSSCVDGSCRYRGDCEETSCAPYCFATNVEKTNGYKQSQSACWNAGNQYETDDNVYPGEFSTTTNNPEDTSMSCCKHCGLNECAVPSNFTCNAQPLRFPFPGFSPLHLMDIVPSVGDTILIIDSSNVLLNATSSLMDNVTTYLLPLGSIFVNGVNQTAYYEKMLLGSDIPAARTQGVYTTLPYGSPVNVNDIIYNLACSYCGVGGDWSNICTTPDDPGVLCWKTWVNGISPWAVYYKMAQSGVPRININVSVNGALAEYDAYDPSNAKALNAGAFLTELQSLTPGSLPDPMMDPVPSGMEAFGGVVITEPYANANVFRYSDIGLTNPYTNMVNPETGAAHCAGCMLDQQPSSTVGNAHTLFYFVTESVKDLFLACTNTAVESYQRSLNKNGFTDMTFQYDDCDSTCIATQPAVDGVWGTLPPYQEYEDTGSPAWTQICPIDVTPACCATQICAGSTNSISTEEIGGTVQSGICTNVFPSQGRPLISSNTIGLLMQQYRNNVELELLAQAEATWQNFLQNYAPLDFNRDHPNYWYGYGLDNILNLFYQVGPIVANTPGAKTLYSTRFRVTVVAGSTLLIPSVPPAIFVLEQIDFCPCVFTDSFATATTYHGTFTATAQQFFTNLPALSYVGTITYREDSDIKCTVNDGNSFTLSSAVSTTIDFSCTKSTGFMMNDNLVGTMIFQDTNTLVHTPPFYIPCCMSFGCYGIGCVMTNRKEMEVGSGYFDFSSAVCASFPACIYYNYQPQLSPFPQYQKAIAFNHTNASGFLIEGADSATVNMKIVGAIILSVMGAVGVFGLIGALIAASQL